MSIHRTELLVALLIVTGCGDASGMADGAVVDGSPRDGGLVSSDASARDATVSIDDAGSRDAAGEPVDAHVDAEDATVATGFVETDGLVVFEAEHYQGLTNTEVASWYTFDAATADPTVECATNTTCGDPENRPDCNQYPECDPDDIDPSDASGDAYVEALPDRRRDDSEPGTSGLGFWGTPGSGPTLIYEVEISHPGRYYVWARARGQGPAANGIHVGIDGTWPSNDLTDPSTMRMQFGNGWAWTQNRRGNTHHTGVPASGGVSVRDANIWLQVDTPGLHTIEISMREDGLELDKLIMTRDPDFTPTSDGPPETRR